MVYKAKRDKIVYLFPIILMACALLSCLRNEKLGNDGLIFTILLCGLIVLFIFSNLITIKYIINESELIIKTCFFKTIIRLDKITNIMSIRGIYSFSASSCEQLKLTYKNDSAIYISPENMSKFVEHLKENIEKSFAK